MKKHKNSWSEEKRLRTVGYTSLGILGAIGILMLCPTITGETNALVEEATVPLSVKVNPLIAVGLGDPVELNGLPATATGEFLYGETSVSVTTNNPTGYDVYLEMADGYTTLHSDDSSDTIDVVSSPTTGGEMQGNTWGAVLSTDPITDTLSTTFKPVEPNSMAMHQPVAGSIQADTAGQTDEYILGFGVHVDNTLAVGTYKNEVIVAVLPNPTYPNITNISDMQTLTSEYCTATPVGTETKLADSRDGQEYYVARLRDGKCWMTQNLAYVMDGALELGKVSGNDGDMWKGNHVTQDHDSYGNYYSWNAAQEACPVGWKLPSMGDYQTLLDGLTASLVANTEPYYMVWAGHVDLDGILRETGQDTYLWSSDMLPNSDLVAQSVALGNHFGNSIAIGYSANIKTGRSVRCIADMN